MTSLELRVELPTHFYSFRIQVLPEWTIQNVKEEIKRVCPGSPKVDGQRVIWRGRLLRDEEQVKDVWKSADDARTIHLSVHPSAWTGAAPSVPHTPATHSAAQPSHIPARQTVRRQGYADVAPQYVGSIPLYIIKKHTDALHALTHGHVPRSSSNTSENPLLRSQAVGAVQAAGWSWPTILDEPYPPSSQATEGVKYETVTIEYALSCSFSQ
ncbi:hypothetical protein NM688_g5926 [Phlebia brevispora]|uniref:Uncharacterized protein n=1 Tax=Phlebia brevispora TaxID=194682 RepID=A0ACC1SMY9_9APHY|nr:hypothetical protein NM688_g5926 [Phlebia brevispora]